MIIAQIIPKKITVLIMYKIKLTYTVLKKCQKVVKNKKLK